MPLARYPCWAGSRCGALWRARKGLEGTRLRPRLRAGWALTASKPSGRGVAVEQFCRDDVEGRFVRRREDHRWGMAGSGGLEPAKGAEAPVVSRDEPREAPLRLRGDQIITDRHREGEKICRHHGADGVRSGIGGDRPTAAVAEEARQRRMGTGSQWPAEDIPIRRALWSGGRAFEGDHRWCICGGLGLRGWRPVPALRSSL